MSFVQLQTVRIPLLNFLLSNDQQTALYNTYHACINAESVERLKYMKEEHLQRMKYETSHYNRREWYMKEELQQRMQYEKEHYDRREKYMKDEHAEKMRILEDADGNGEIGKQRGAEERDEMEVDDTEPKIEAREQDEGVEKSGNKRKSSAENSEQAKKKRGWCCGNESVWASDGRREYAALKCIDLHGKKRT